MVRPIVRTTRGEEVGVSLRILLGAVGKRGRWGGGLLAVSTALGNTLSYCAIMSSTVYNQISKAIGVEGKEDCLPRVHDRVRLLPTIDCMGSIAWRRVGPHTRPRLDALIMLAPEFCAIFLNNFIKTTIIRWLAGGNCSARFFNPKITE